MRLPTCSAPKKTCAASRAWLCAGPKSLLSVQTNAISPLRGFESARFRRVMDDATGTQASQGNAVLPLFDGVNSFAERDRLIDSATHSVLLETFIFSSDDTGWALARKLAAKAEQGLKVCVIYDALGTGKVDSTMFDFMREHGVEVRSRSKNLRTINTRWHEKLLIVDGEHAITGGMNVANEYAYGGTDKAVLSRSDESQKGWRDADVRVSGSVVRSMALDFVYNWKALGTGFSDADEQALLDRAKPVASGGVQARFIERKSNATQADTGVDAYYYAITAAQTSITIENAYFAPTQEIREALIDAVKRGVKVRVLTNSPQSNDLAIVQDVMRHWYAELVAGGVEIHEKTGSTLHAKTATFDGIFSFVGSMNLNQRSAHLDSECLVAITDPSTAHALEQRFDTGMAVSNPVTADSLSHWSLWTRASYWGAQVLAGRFT